MTVQVKPADLQAIADRTGKTVAEVQTFLDIVRNGMLPESKRIPVIEDGEKRYYTVTRLGVGPITVAGDNIFWQFDFRIDDSWEKYSVLTKSRLDTKLFQPIFENTAKLLLRTDSGCETGQMFGDLTCECRDQLLLAMDAITQNGEGMIVNIPRQDGRGMGLPFKLGTLWLQEGLGVTTIESASMLAPGGVIDIRTYAGVIAILRFFGIPETCEINLATNNEQKARIFGENDYTLNGEFVPMHAQPTKYTEMHLAAKAEHLHHRLGTVGNPRLIPGAE